MLLLLHLMIFCTVVPYTYKQNWNSFTVFILVYVVYNYWIKFYENFITITISTSIKYYYYSTISISISNQYYYYYYYYIYSDFQF